MDRIFSTLQICSEVGVRRYLLLVYFWPVRWLKESFTAANDESDSRSQFSVHFHLELEILAWMIERPCSPVAVALNDGARIRMMVKCDILLTRSLQGYAKHLSEAIYF
jgi:hypothetical protein